MNNAIFRKTALTLGLLGLASGAAQSAELMLESENISGRFDVLVSAGALFRTEGQSRMLAATEDPLIMLAGGYSTQLNKNDGNNNFDPGLAQMVYKITPELELNFGDNWGFLARATGFYDSVIMEGGHDGGALSAGAPFPVPGPGGIYNRYASYSDFANNGTGNRFSKSAKSEAGRRGRLLDLYVYTDQEVFDRPLNVRLGRQAINWGEALFMQNGVNTANYVDLAALRLPGSEIKEAILPLGSLYFNYGLTDALSMEAFYQFEWENSLDAPAGTYWSTHDAFPGKGANNVIVDGRLVQAALYAQGLVLPVGDAFANYNATNGTNLEYELTQVTVKRVADQKAKDDGQFGLGFRYYAPFMNGVELGAFFTRTHSRLPVVGARLTTLNPNTGNNLTDAAAIIDATEYKMVYVEDVDMFGFSFATTALGISLSGEVAYRPKQPVMNEVGDNLISNLASVGVAAGLTGTAPAVSDFFTTPHCVRIEAGGGCIDSATPVDEGQLYYFYDEAETFTTSLVGIYNFGTPFGTNGLMGILELGAESVHGLGLDCKGNSCSRYASTGSIADSEAAVLSPNNRWRTNLTSLSWGYRAILQAEYSNIFSGVNMRPSLRFMHDVEGYSPLGGNFLENRKAGTVGVDFIYQNNFEVGLQATKFWGNEYSNKLADRDNASIALKYAF